MSGAGAVIAVIVASFFIGWWASSLRDIPGGLLRLADRWVVQIALPALVIARIGTIKIGSDLLVPLAAAWSAMAISAVVVLVAARLASWNRSTTGALLMVAVLGNTSFLGLGVVGGVLGESHLTSAVAYDQPGTFLALATWGSWVASRWGGGESGVTPVARRLVRFPPFLALVAAVAIRPVGIPDGVVDVLAVLGVTVAPVAMAAVGARFSLRVVRRVTPVVIGLATKMVVAPLCVLMAAYVFGEMSAVPWEASIVQASAPPMVTAGIVAVSAGLDDDVTNSVVGWGTLIGLVSMPLVAWLV